MFSECCCGKWRYGRFLLDNFFTGFSFGIFTTTSSKRSSLIIPDLPGLPLSKQFSPSKQISFPLAANWLVSKPWKLSTTLVNTSVEICLVPFSEATLVHSCPKSVVNTQHRSSVVLAFSLPVTFLQGLLGPMIIDDGLSEVGVTISFEMQSAPAVGFRELENAFGTSFLTVSCNLRLSIGSELSLAAFLTYSGCLGDEW